MSHSAEIEVPRRVASIVLTLIVIASVAVLGFLGWANSPRGGDGRPLLLTAERRAVLRYLNTAEGWVERLTETGERLESLMPPEAKVVEGEDAILPTLPAPGEQPVDLYQRTHDAQAACTALQGIRGGTGAGAGCFGRAASGIGAPGAGGAPAVGRRGAGRHRCAGVGERGEPGCTASGCRSDLGCFRGGTDR